MQVPRHIESEILISLYRYSMMTSSQLSLLLNYEIDTLYKAFQTMRSKGWIESLSLDFIRRNARGWVLTKGGMEVAFGLTKEYRTGLLRKTGTMAGQIPHLHGVNRFFTNLIRESASRPRHEGLVEWIGMRDAGDRYAQVDSKGKWNTPLRPDGIGTYHFSEGGDLVFHVEYDTGSEHIWILHHKLWQYADILSKFWADISLANVLFITREDSRCTRIHELWTDLCSDALNGQPVPAVWTVTEKELERQGAFGPVWRSSDGRHVTWRDLPRLQGSHDGEIPLGKQVREQPFPSRAKRGWSR